MTANIRIRELATNIKSFHHLILVVIKTLAVEAFQLHASIVPKTHLTLNSSLIFNALQYTYMLLHHNTYMLLHHSGKHGTY